MKSIITLIMAVALSMFAGCVNSPEKAVHAVSAASSLSYVMANYDGVKSAVSSLKYSDEEVAKLKRLEPVLDQLRDSIVAIKDANGDFKQVTLSAQEIVELYALARIVYKQSSEIILPKLENLEDPFVQLGIQKFHRAAVQLDASVQELVLNNGNADATALAVSALELTATVVKLLVI